MRVTLLIAALAVLVASAAAQNATASPTPVATSVPVPPAPPPTATPFFHDLSAVTPIEATAGQVVGIFLGVMGGAVVLIGVLSLVATQNLQNARAYVMV